MKKYNLSRIMNRAHYIFRHSFNVTFSYSLKKAWAEAKEEVRVNEYNARLAAEHKAKYGARDYRNYRSYYGSRMGRDDWKRNYRNDVRTAINRSIELKRL